MRDEGVDAMTNVFVFVAGMVTMWLIGRAAIQILRHNGTDRDSLGRRARQKALTKSSPDRFQALWEDVSVERGRRILMHEVAAEKERLR